MIINYQYLRHIYIRYSALSDEHINYKSSNDTIQLDLVFNMLNKYKNGILKLITIIASFIFYIFINILHFICLVWSLVVAGSPPSLMSPPSRFSLCSSSRNKRPKKHINQIHETQQPTERKGKSIIL